ncbi:MAG TPA: sodium:proton antiporter NhaD [Steroidobacteraceae bacterium]|nr:sodium:proton antiporter NhaD [Steroidobacteraceae bacterium]
MRPIILAAFAVLVPSTAFAETTVPNLTTSAMGVLALALFVLAYGFVIAEEFTHLRKSKPVMIAAGVLWMLVAIAWQSSGITGVGELLRHNLLEYSELLLFLLAAMTFVNTLADRNVFAALRSWLIERGWTLRTIFWVTGAMAFVLSPLLDNLTTALVMGAVVMASGRGYPALIAPACINIVVAANAGGAFSPFGDITTLMVWQKGLLGFFDFFALFVPSLVNWLVPAFFMSFVIPRTRPEAHDEHSDIKTGGKAVIVLFALTVAMTVALHQYAHLPPFLGMMTGLGILQVHGYFVRREELRLARAAPVSAAPPGFKPADKPFDIFISLKRAEWDTLLFFYGVVLCVGALGAFGYLAALSAVSYEALGATWANVLVGIASAIVDNIPVMFAVLSIEPDMSSGQWLLVTLTAGVGGSLLSIGSAAGVALMGQARSYYTFFAHLKWTWAIALGYAASIWVHLLLNAASFD